ncbi:MAG: glycosyltransferase family 4 protein [Candidatus Obscuribacterales bacterium]|nr:glycosyltransferase family 4 protein [Candidatus Obscuribacterales bacterium]
MTESSSVSPLRVLMLAWEYPPNIVGGLARVVHALSHKLVQRGCEVYVVTADHKDSPAYENDNGVHVYRVKNQTDWTPDFNTQMARLNVGMIQLAVRLQIDEPFDVVHAHDWMVLDTAWTLKQVFDVKLVSTFHATEHGRMKGIHNDTQKYVHSIEGRMFYESVEVIVNSRSMVGELEWQFAAPTDKINVIPNGIDANKFACSTDVAELRTKHGIEHEDVVLFVGRMVFEKGVQVLLDAVPAILQERPNTTFILAGTGGFFEGLKAKAHELSVSQNVRFFGHANDKDLAELFQLATIMVVPSLYEPFGITALEAMAARVVLVTSDRGGLNDINDHMRVGLKTYAERPESIAWAVTTALADPALRARLIDAAFTEVQEHYTWDAIADKTLVVYRRVLQGD